MESRFFQPHITAMATRMVNDIVQTALTHQLNARKKSVDTASISPTSSQEELVAREEGRPLALHDTDMCDRLIRGHELRVMASVPLNIARFLNTTLLLPNGVYRYNHEVQRFKCFIDQATFRAHFGSYWLHQAADLDPNIHPQGQVVTQKWNVTEINLLEKIMREHHGPTVLGYHDNETLFILAIENLAWLCHLNTSAYPPVSNAYSRKWLALINRPLVFDVSLALRSGLWGILVTTFISRAYFSYHQNGEAAYFSFFSKYVQWDLLGMGAVSITTLVLLRSGFLNKQWLTKKIHQITLAEEAMIATAENLENYGQLFLSETMLSMGLFPAIAYGLYQGYVRKEHEVINLATPYFPRLTMICNSVDQALTVGSFCRVGMDPIINSLLFYYANLNDPSVIEQFYQDLRIIQYSAFSVMLCASLLRYPFLPHHYQTFGRYASNLLNGISRAFIDNYALFFFVAYSIGAIYGDGVSTKQPMSVTAIYFFLQALISLYTFGVVLPNTPNLPDFSLEACPDQPPARSRLLKQCCSPCYSAPKIDTDDIESQQRQAVVERPSWLELSHFSQHHPQPPYNPELRNPLHQPLM